MSYSDAIIVMHIYFLKELYQLNCALFTGCISEVNNSQIDNAKDIDVVMPMYNLIEYSDNYFKTRISFWKGLL